MSSRVRLAIGLGSALDMFQACVIHLCLPGTLNSSFLFSAILPRIPRPLAGGGDATGPSSFHHAKSPHPDALLPRHGDADSSFRVNQMICVLRGVGDRKLHTFDFAVEGVAVRTIIRGDGRSAVLADIAAVVG